MNEQIPDRLEPLPRDTTVTADENKARSEWQYLGARLRAISPTDLLRMLLIVGTLGLLAWLIVYTWPALLPFTIGAALAYVLLPMVNRLDCVMPRRIAALLVMTTAVGVLGLILTAVIPTLLRQFLRLVAILPSAEELRSYIESFAPVLEQLPEPLQNELTDSANQATMMLRQAVAGLAEKLPGLVSSILLSLISVIGTVLGLLILPTWLLIVLADQRKGTEALNRLLPVAVQPDFWAVVRIADRVFRAFFQGQVLQGFVAGLLSYLTIIGLNYTGHLQVVYPLVVALFIGLMELIPEIGPIVAMVVLGISGALVSPVYGLFGIGLFILIHRVTAHYVEAWTQQRIRPIHPALMVIGIVLLSELGLVWVFLSVPLLTGAHDLLSYMLGRLANPPRPAGFIPGQPIPDESANVPRRMPLVYRRAAIGRKR